jgi:hypothetical protein
MPLLSRFSRRTARAEASLPSAMVELLEDRKFFSAAPAVAAIDVTAPLKTQTAVFANKIAKNGTTTMIPLTITGVQVVNGALNAVGKIGNTPFSVPLTLTSSPNAADPTCPILNLHLGEIHLDLLGLHVDTSEICLKITAHEGGGLLGDLLCGVSNLLNQGSPLGGILGGLTQTNLNNLLGGLTSLLNNVLGQLTAPTAVVGAGQSAAAAAHGGHVCDVLNLSVGPVDLNLLGLQVHLDNCHNGPITLDITAEPGSGNLLGNLLCNVTNLLNNPSNPNALANLLGRISNLIGGLV